MKPLPKTTPTERLLTVTYPFDGSIVGTVAESRSDELPTLLSQAQQGAREAKALSRARRAEILENAAAHIETASESFARQITAEAGKTIRQSRKEVSRCINTLKLSAVEARRGGGEVIAFDAYAGSEQRQGWFTREPLGIIVAITPYNDPLNLAAHKLGPAIAGGNSVLLKPSELAPLSALALVEALVASGLPDSVVTPVVGGADLGHALVSARDVRMISFTGGFETAEAIAASAGLKKLAMDLGGNAPVLVMEDADIDKAVDSCVSGAFWAAGQNCIGTQRIFVARVLYEEFASKFVSATRGLRVGNPALDDTDVGPMISEDVARRTQAKVEAALSKGAKLLAGHIRNGALYAPTVLADVPHDCTLWREEAFAPVVTLEPFDDVDAAIAMANAVEFSLHAGVFTTSLEGALMAADRIDASGIMINDSSDYRFDAMPFGGFKRGSLGREGVRFAYEEMTQPKVMCFNRG